MTQSRRQSAMETAVNIGIGYSVNFLANLTVLPLFGYNISVRDNVGIGLIYTVISVVRGYCIRRGFNAWHVMQANAYTAQSKGSHT